MNAKEMKRQVKRELRKIGFIACILGLLALSACGKESTGGGSPLPIPDTSKLTLTQ